MDKGGTAPSALRQPGGGGAVSSIGSDFQTNLNTGVGTYSVPIELPTGYRSQTPRLALQYSSGAGHGDFGLGWALPTMAIRRNIRNGVPSYGPADRFLLNADELVQVGPDLYRPHIDPTFQRVRRLAAGWEVTDRQGTRFILGSSVQAREQAPDHPDERAALAWFLERVVDTSGNETTYTYLRDGGRLYLASMEYAVYRVEVAYEARPDVRSVRRAGFEQRSRLRGESITVARTDLAPGAVRRYELAYLVDPLARHSLLASVTLRGFGLDPGDPDEVAPALRFGYTTFEPQRRHLTTLRSRIGQEPPGLGDPAVEVIDLEGFGLPGVLEGRETTHRYWPNRGDGTWDAAHALRSFPAGIAIDDERVRFGDMDGDGRADLLVSAGALSGFYPGESGATWGSLRPYRHNRPTFDARDRGVRLVDANGDGRVDALGDGRNGFLLYEGRGAAGWQQYPRPIPRRRNDPTFPDVALADPTVRLADMSGDGGNDIVRLFGRHLEYWPSLGAGRWDSRRILTIPEPWPERVDPRRFHLADVNGDGLADLLYLTDDAVYVWVNQYGEQLSSPTKVAYPPPAAPTATRTTDVLGTGTSGLLFALSARPGLRAPYRFLDFTGGKKPYLLASIDNGVGKLTSIEYGSSTRHRLRDRDAGRDWTSFLPRAIQVVDLVRHDDAASGASSTTSIHYRDGHYDSAVQRFAGFREVETIEDTGNDAPVLTRSIFHLGLPDDSATVPRVDAIGLRGLLRTKSIFGLDGTPTQGLPYLVEQTEWTIRKVAEGLDGERVLCPLPATRSVERVERAAARSRLVTELTHDDFGNVVTEVQRGVPVSPVEPDLEITITGTFVNDEANWVLGLMAQRTKSSAGHRFDDVRCFYDDQPFGAASAGLLRRRERFAFSRGELDAVIPGITDANLVALGYRAESVPGDTEFWFNEHDVDHDARGNIVVLRDAIGNATEITYDAAGLLPIETRNAAGHLHRANYHPRLDAITALTDPAGNITTYAYTPLGRVRQEVRPGDTPALPTVEYEYKAAGTPTSTVMRRRRRSGQAALATSVTYYDGSGNEVDTRARLDDGTFQVARRELRDQRNLVVEVRAAFISASDAFDLAESAAGNPHFRYAYDPLKRTTRVVDPAGRVSRADFAPESVTFFDTQDTDVGSPFANTPRVQQVDPFGRLVSVEEQLPSGAIRTEYRYDPRGDLTDVTDASGIQLLTQSFDHGGRRIEVNHRDAGRRRFLHDARGSLALYVDAAGRRVSWRFDSIGRTTSVAYDGHVIEQFTYDAGAGSNLEGRLASVTDRGGSQSFGYNARGLVSATSRTITGAAGAFGYAFEYDADDRPLATTYPDGAVVTSTYDALGRLASLSGLIDAVTYDEAGRRGSVDYASGLRETRSYEAGLGRLQEHRLVVASSGAEIQRQQFTYDSADNVTAIDDARTPGPGVELVSRDFEYDALNRLTRARSGPLTAPSDHAYAYDAIGNLTRNDSWRPEPITYDGSRITGVIGPAGPEALFSHDANGCLSERPGMTLEFEARDLLDRVVLADGTRITLAYDYAARRLRKTVARPSGTAQSFYAGEGFEVRPDGSSVRYVNDPDGWATFESVSTGGSRVLHHDYLGNVIVVVAAAAAKAVRYTAYGTHQSDADLPDILFGGKRLDRETGLYYFRLRYYDPLIGRFISPDPLLLTRPELGRVRPLSLNLYAYSLDNPMRFNDQSGLLTFWEGFLTVLAVAAIVVATALTFGAAGVIALAVGAAVGGLIGGLTTGSVEGALLGAMLGFGIVATVLGGLYFGALIGGAFGAASAGTSVGAFVGGFSAGIQAFGFIPGARQNDAYKDLLGYASWINPWSWPGHIVGGLIFIINAVVYGVAYVVTWGDPPDWADMSVSFEEGMVVTEGGLIHPDRAFNFGAFTNLNPNINPTDRAAILRHERGHMLNNAYFGLLQVGRIGAGDQQESFWEQLAESNTNPNVPGLSGDKDSRRRAGGRGFGDIPWWTP